MQTFLPYPSFRQSMLCLDLKRLGNQCYNEGMVLLSGKWKNHPASKMWRGYDRALASYILTGLHVLETEYDRWYPVQQAKLCSKYDLNEQGDNYIDTPPIDMPPWIGNEAFHASHRSNLLRKDPIHYRKFGWMESDTLEYVWPVSDRL